MLAYRDLSTTQRKPLVGVMHLNPVQAVTADSLEQPVVITHQPDDQFPARFHSRVDDRMLEILNLAVLLEDEVDLGMLFRAGIQFAGPGRQFVLAGLAILKFKRLLRRQN